MLSLVDPARIDLERVSDAFEGEDRAADVRLEARQIRIAEEGVGVVPVGAGQLSLLQACRDHLFPAAFGINDHRLGAIIRDEPGAAPALRQLLLPHVARQALARDAELARGPCDGQAFAEFLVGPFKLRVARGDPSLRPDRRLTSSGMATGLRAAKPLCLAAG